MDKNISSLFILLSVHKLYIEGIIELAKIEGDINMILEEELIELMKQNGLNCFKLENDVSKLENRTLYLYNANIDELLRFIKFNDIRNVFYKYSYYDESEYKINPYKISSLINIDFCEEIENEITEHNNEIQQIDFSRPSSVEVFVMYKDHYIAIRDSDLWIDDLYIESSGEKISTLLNEYEDIMIDKRDQLLKEFKEHLINYDEFKKCTNQAMRVEYISSLMEKREFKKYMNAFLSRGNYGSFCIDKIRLSSFAKKTWDECKSQK